MYLILGVLPGLPAFSVSSPGLVMEGINQALTACALAAPTWEEFPTVAEPWLGEQYWSFRTIIDYLICASTGSVLGKQSVSDPFTILLELT